MYGCYDDEAVAGPSPNWLKPAYTVTMVTTEVAWLFIFITIQCHFIVRHFFAKYAATIYTSIMVVATLVSDHVD